MGKLFGTDGVRGVAGKDLTCELALQIGRATAAELTSLDGHRPRILIGKDTRVSGDMLECTLAAGLCSVGADVDLLGVIPTPGVAYLVRKYGADAGIVISASHNPMEFNGIKIFSGDGYKLPDALEEQIEAIVLDHVDTPPVPVGGDLGTVSTAPNVVRDYVDHVKSTVPFSLDGLRIAIDCANGASCRTAETLFTELGAECHMLANEPNGVNVNDKCGSTHMEALMEYVKTHDVDAGIAFDGDADRCLAVDENGNFVDGDFIMAICAADMKSRGKLAKSTVVGTITAIGLSKSRKVVQKMVERINDLPVMNPDIVTAISLLMFFSVLTVKKGFGTLLIAHIMFCIPYVMLSVTPKLRSLDPNLIDAAMDLGATPFQALTKVIVPQIKPGIVSGALIAFTMSFDDFVISYFTTGNGVNNISILVYTMSKRVNPSINALSTIVILSLIHI